MKKWWSVGWAVAGIAVLAVQVGAQDVIVSPEWLSENLVDVTVVNVEFRPDDFDEEHIPGAHQVMWESFVSNEVPNSEMRSVEEMAGVFRKAGVSNDEPVVVYSSHPIAASRAFLVLEYLGHERVHVLDGGLAAWKDAGMTVESGAIPAAEGTFTPNPRPEILVDSDWMMENMDNASVNFIDARPDDEYTGEGVEESEMMKRGHIPGANQIFYSDLIRDMDGDRRFLDLDGLVARFDQANAEDGQTLVSYCMVGMRASVTYMVSRHLGYDAKFYDGSWHDWSMKDLPRVEGPDPKGN